MQASGQSLPSDGLIVVVKRDCPTCVLTEPVLAELAGLGALTVYTQDDPTFPESVGAIDDTGLDMSHRLGIEVVPTVIRRQDGKEIDASLRQVRLFGSRHQQ